MQRWGVCFVLIMFFGLMAPRMGFGDLIRFTNGSEIEGKATDLEDGRVEIFIPGTGSIIVQKDEVESIVASELVTDAAPAEESQAGDERVQAETVIEEPPPPAQVTVSPRPIVTGQPSPAQTFVQTHSANLQFLKKADPKTILFVLLGFVFAFYAYFAACLYLIATKTGTSNAMLAWVPFLNVLLMCWVADLSAYWLIALFALSWVTNLVPFPFSLVLVALLNIAVPIVWGVRVAKRRGKSPMLGYLYFIPVLNFLILGYFAFSNGATEDKVKNVLIPDDE